MSDETTNESVELDDAFFEAYAKKIKDENQSNGNGGKSYDPPEYEEIGYVGCERGVFTIVRLIGAPIGAESQGYKRKPYDPKEIIPCEVKDDEGKPVGKESFMYLASNGIVTKGMWEALFNARHYDGDIAAATEKARATALNDKVQNNLRQFDAGVPNLSGGGKGAGEKAPKKKGGFAAFGEDL